MNSLLALSSDVSLSSLDYLEQFINPARLEAGKAPLQNFQLVKKLKDELDLDDDQFLIGRNSQGNETRFVMMDCDQMMLIGMRECKEVRKAVLAKLHDLAEQNHVLKSENMKLELEVKKHEVAMLTFDDQIDALQKTKLMRDLEFHLNAAKAVGSTFDINQYLTANNISPEAAKHLGSIKSLIGSSISELGGIEKPYNCVTTLLRDNLVEMKPSVFNGYLEALGILRQREVTDYGKRFGFNFKSGNTVQPRWYEDKFKELIDLVYQEIAEECQ